MRIGVMGGTFDPIHVGHLAAASQVAHDFALEQVVFVPAGLPWQKTHRTVSPAEDRYLMTVIATATDPRFAVSRVDIDRPGPTYTVDTLRDLAGAYGDDAELFFITGADALAEILSWREPEEVLRLAHLIGVTRPGHVLADPGIDSSRVTLCEIPSLAISSSDIRARMGAGAPIRYLVPDGVEIYLRKQGLYAP